MNNTSIRSKIKFLVLSAMFIAIVFVATFMVQIPLPGIATGGLIHLGNVALFTIAILFGKKYGAISGAFGMALFDLMSGWAIWAPGTFIIRGIMGYTVGLIAGEHAVKKTSLPRLSIALILPSVWMILGYLLYNLILYRNMAAAIASIPGDIIQVGIGIVMTIPIIMTLTASGTTNKLNQMAKLTD